MTQVRETHASELERRSDERVASVVQATLHLPARAPALILPSRVVDLSEHGMRLLVRRPLEVGSLVLVDLACQLPQRVHLGFDADALVVDGPVSAHELSVLGEVTWARRQSADRIWEVGLRLRPLRQHAEELELLRMYVEFLRGDQDLWSY